MKDLVTNLKMSKFVEDLKIITVAKRGSKSKRLDLITMVHLF